ncbi:MAG: hypothetical protein HOP27_17970 [Anaerolineales bacterium]|nr:hypothetical protein [Anaerolineales bacterium]
MNISEYWIGKDIDYESVWQAYEEGAVPYIDKFRSMRVHLLRIELKEFPSDLPLFNHEAVYKTIKGYFHDLKRYGLSEDEYWSTGPLFLYSVDRGSGIWNFLGELQPLIALAVTVVGGMDLNQELANIDKKLQMIQKYFPDANPNDIKMVLRANSRQELRFALSKLAAQGIRGVQISQKPFEGNFEEAVKSLIDFMKPTVHQYFGSPSSVTGVKVQETTIQANGAGFVTVGDNNDLSGAIAKTQVTTYDGTDNLGRLVHELSQLREILHRQAIRPERDVEVGQIAAAEIAARSGDKRGALLHLKNVGSWTLDFATKVGASLTAELIKRGMGI